MRRSGFTLIEVLIVVVIVGILTTMAIPNFTKARERVQKDTCINNLRQIKLAKEEWALENNMEYSNVPTAANLDNYIKDGTANLHCPLHPDIGFAGTYNIANVGTDPTCLFSPNHRL